MSETPTVRTHLIALADTELTLGWSHVLAAARVIQSRHELDSKDDVLAMCCDAAREASLGELRWVWARLVNKFIEAVESDV